MTSPDVQFACVLIALCLVQPVVLGEDALRAAVDARDVAQIQKLIDGGADPSKKDPGSKNTPLHLAASSGHLEVAKALLDRGASITAGDVINQSPLHYAAMFGHTQMIALLLDFGAKVDAVDDAGDAPLKWAAHQGHVESVKLLLARGAKVDATDKLGRTALQAAATQGHFNVVRCLVEGGANVKTTWRGLSILTSATAGPNRVELTKYLIEKDAPVVVPGPNQLEPLEEAVLQGDFQTVELLLGHSFDLKKPSNQVRASLLHLAVRTKQIQTQEDRLKLVQRLLRAGVDPNTRDYKAKTAIDYATAEGMTALVAAMKGDPAPATSPSLPRQ